jgi:hypothetical protein
MPPFELHHMKDHEVTAIGKEHGDAFADVVGEQVAGGWGEGDFPTNGADTGVFQLGMRQQLTADLGLSAVSTH